MKGYLWLVAAMLIPACGEIEQEEQAGSGVAQVAIEASTPQHREGFALLRGTDTLLVERYSRTGDSLESELTDARSGDRFTYRATIGADERITRIQMEAYSRGAAEPQQRATGEFRGDTLVAETYRGSGAGETERVQTPSGTLLVVANSIVALEQVIRHSRTLGGDQVEFPVLLVGGSDGERQAIQRVRVNRLPGDSVHLVVDDGNQIRAATDGQGRIVGGVSPPGEARVVRLR